MHNSLHKYITFLCLLFFSLVRYSDAVDINYSRPYIVVNVETGDVFAAHNAFQPWYPASLTKLMTSYLTFKAMAAGKLNKASKVVLSRYDVSQAPSKSNYKAGTILSLDHALNIMLVKSTNDIATALGSLIAKNQINFVNMMNHQAKLLGMNDSHFASANGLPNVKNYSTARDLALLALALRRDFPQYCAYFNIKYLKLGGQSKTILNSNNLLGRYRGINGMKTGFICASGYNLIASAKRADSEFIAVILGAPRLDIREEVAASLLETAFNSSFSRIRKNIYDMQKTKIYNKAPPNLRNEMCSAKAIKSRLPYLTHDFRPIIISPYIKDDRVKAPVVAVMPLYMPGKFFSKAKKKNQPKISVTSNESLHIY